MTKGRAIPYSREELEFLEWRQAFTRRDLHAAFVKAFARDDVTLDHIKALCKRKGWMTGRTGCFEKGHAPANKGKPFPTAANHPNCRRTHFPKGSRNGRAAKIYKPVGTERLSKDGYLERKIHDGMPLQSRWRAVHLILWEQEHGPLPQGHCLKCLDGDKTNTDPSNWIAIPRAMLPRLNGRYGRDYDAAPAALKPAILATVKLEHAAREAKRGKAG